MSWIKFFYDDDHDVANIVDSGMIDDDHDVANDDDWL